MQLTNKKIKKKYFYISFSNTRLSYQYSYVNDVQKNFILSMQFLKGIVIRKKSLFDWTQNFFDWAAKEIVVTVGLFWFSFMPFLYSGVY